MTKFIAKDQIQKGDRIRVTFEEWFGVSTVLTGIADSKDSDGDWWTEQGGYIYIDMSDKVSAIELLERPLPTEPGTVFRATKIRGRECDVVVLVRGATEYYRAMYFSSAHVGGSDMHRAEHITAWEPLDAED